LRTLTNAVNIQLEKKLNNITPAEPALQARAPAFPASAFGASPALTTLTGAVNFQLEKN
jgi:hypothetical protein